MKLKPAGYVRKYALEHLSNRQNHTTIDSYPRTDDDIALYTAPDVNWPENEEFYNLMQAYRHAPMEDQKAVVDAYEAVKEYLRGLH